MRVLSVPFCLVRKRTRKTEQSHVLDRFHVSSGMGHTAQVAEAQAELGRLRDRIATLEQEKADLEAFAAVAAHELLAPVVMIDACAAMVTDRLDEADHAESHRDLDTM